MKKVKKEQHQHTDEIEVTELLFWKIFRNIVLFKNIFSNFTNKRMYSYYDIDNDLYSLFSKFNNPIEIILDKIKSNNHHSIINNEKNIRYLIFELSKDTKENRLFFNKLFSNTSIIFQDDNEEWMNNIILDPCINYSNYVALEEFIKLFKIDLKVIKEFVKLNIAENQDYFNHFSFKKFKILNYLKSNDYLPKEESRNISFGINSINFNINSFSINYQFKELIKSQQLFINQFYNNNKKDSINNLINEINQFNLLNMDFKKEYLKLGIYKLLKSNISDEIKIGGCQITLTDIIYKCYKLVFKIHKLNNPDFKKPIEYHIFFKKDLDKVIKKIQVLSNGKKKLYEFIIPLLEVNLKSKQERIQFLSKMFQDDKNNDYFSKKSDNHNNNTIYAIRDIIMSSNDVDVIDHFIKLVSTNTIPHLKIDKSTIVSSILESSIRFIKSKELLDYFFIYQNEILFDQESDMWTNLPCFSSSTEIESSDHHGDDGLSILEHYENLMNSLDRKILLLLNNFQYDFKGYIFYFNRAIKIGPSIYNIEKDGDNPIGEIFEYEYTNGKNTNVQKRIETMISILSNVKLNYPLDLDSMIYITSLVPSTLNIIKFLFHNISKESIEIILNQGINSNNDYIKLTTTLELINHVNAKKVFGEFIVEKPSSIEFYISLYLLMPCLYYLDRFDDIIYLYKSVPNILSKFSETTHPQEFYKICSIYYLELFINYFINNENNNKDVINHLYDCLCIAASKGFIQIFKNLLSSSNNLFKVKDNITTSTNSQPSLFESNLLYEVVSNSIDSYNLELPELLINNINFSIDDKESLKSKILSLNQ